MQRTRIITSRIPLPAAGQSLASYCAGRFSYLSLEQWQREIAAGKLSLDGANVLNPALTLQGGEMLAWDGSCIVEPEVDDRITILYKDEWFTAVDKPGNLPVHPAGRYFNNTLVALMQERCGRKVYPVHRLDRETSGVLLLAFDEKSAGSLSTALMQGSKEYLALVQGVFPDKELIVELPLGRDSESTVRKKRRAWTGGNQSAVTRFQKVLTTGDASLVRCFPQTGRLHQIRAHLLSAGFPIVGDKLYGRDETAFLTFIEHGLTAELLESLILPRAALHAACLIFSHPYNKQKMVIQAPLPRMFSEFISSRKANG
ncbi:MAG: RluA family pseudouridine synthase [Smithellaceae bacterium]